MINLLFELVLKKCSFSLFGGFFWDNISTDLVGETMQVFWKESSRTMGVGEENLLEQLTEKRVFW